MSPLLALAARPAENSANLARISAFAALLTCSATVFAQGPGEDGPQAMSWSLGIGAISMQKPYTGIDRDSMVLPVLQFESKYFTISGPQIGLKLPSLDISASRQLNFSIVARYDGSGYKSNDAAILSGMSERKSGFLAGAEVEWKNDVVDVKAAWLADASGNSKGQLFSLGFERTWHVGGHIMLMPRVEATWHDKKSVDYYFGVRDSEARLDRPAYAGKAGTSAEVGVRGIYMFDQQHSVFLDVAVSSLAKGVKDSPLVDRSTENRVLLGYTYRFR